MAADLGELLVPYMPTIRVPKTGDRVFKSECAFSYDSPESEGGLYVCMNTFLGFGREHVERHYRKTGQSVYMHLKRHVKEKATGAAGGAIPRRRNGKVFLDLELNRDFNGDEYDCEDEAKLVIFPDHFEIPLPNIEELPALNCLNLSGHGNYKVSKAFHRDAGPCGQCFPQLSSWLDVLWVVDHS